MSKKKKFNKILLNIFTILVFIIGFTIFLYPYLSNFINVYTQTNEIKKYKVSVLKLSPEDNEKVINEAYEFNKKLLGNYLVQNQEYVKKSDYNNILSLNGDGVMGCLKISKIDVRLPIYHGTSDAVLQNGIGHLEGSSFPIGKESEHSVLVGHTGFPSSKLLTDLVELKAGDTFEVVILNKVLQYEVDQILVVEPNETDSLKIEEGKTYCTLITCTPYGVNSHRLLVRGKLKENKMSDEITMDAEFVDSNIVVVAISLALIFILLIIMIIFSIRKKGKDIDWE